MIIVTRIIVSKKYIFFHEMVCFVIYRFRVVIYDVLYGKQLIFCSSFFLKRIFMLLLIRNDVFKCSYTCVSEVLSMVECCQCWIKISLSVWSTRLFNNLPFKNIDCIILAVDHIQLVCFLTFPIHLDFTEFTLYKLYNIKYVLIDSLTLSLLAFSISLIQYWRYMPHFRTSKICIICWFYVLLKKINFSWQH